MKLMLFTYIGYFMLPDQSVTLSVGTIPSSYHATEPANQVKNYWFYNIILSMYMYIYPYYYRSCIKI